MKFLTIKYIILYTIKPQNVATLRFYCVKNYVFFSGDIQILL